MWWLRRPEIETDCWLAELGGLAPHPTHNLAKLRDWVVRGFTEGTHTNLLGPSKTLIILAVDGVSYEVASSVWSPDVLCAVTSTFPSVSSTAWLSATTGLTPAQHGVVGAVFADDAVEGAYHCYLDQQMSLSGAPSHVQGIEMGPWPTMFSVLEDKGVHSIAHIGDLASVPGRWSNAVTHGARVVQPQTHRGKAAEVHPEAMVRTATTGIKCSLHFSEPGRPTLLWVYLNIDEHIHLHGYDASVHAALAHLEDKAVEWTAAGHTVLAHSDHGQVPTQSSDRAERLLKLINDPRLCRAPSGGAGRTLWAYPKAERAQELRGEVAALAGSFAHILSPADLARSGLIELTPLVQQRVGPLVIMAKGEEFPLFNRDYTFEHGSIHPQEMLVPVALWRGH